MIPSTPFPGGLWILYFDKTREKNALYVALYGLFGGRMLQ